jgi:hypothetical protein
MENAKPKKATGATAVEAYIGARIRDPPARSRNEPTCCLAANMLLAKALVGTTFQQIQKYEKVTNRISAERLLEICKALKVPLSSIFPKE